MNKNTKKFVVTLLSVLMVLSFMPAMSFAADADHSWKVDKEKSVPATCTAGGYDIMYCDAEGCNVTKAVLTPATGHEYPENGVQYTVAEYIEEAAKQGATEAELEELAEVLAGYCYVYAKSCKKCGALGAPYDLEGHTRPNGVAKCAESYTCAFCKKIVNEEMNNHAYKADGSDYETVAWFVCSKEHDVEVGVDGLDKQVRTCPDCGKEQVRFVTAVDYRFNYYSSRTSQTRRYVDYDAETPLDALTQTGWVSVPGSYQRVETNAKDAYLEAHVAHEVSPANPQPTGDATKDYVEYNEKYYEPNKVTKPATCTTEGTNSLVCPACSMEIGSVAIPKTDHAWATVTVPPTCYLYGFTMKYCPDCGALGTITKGDKALGHDYKVSVISEPNCEYDGLTVIDCTRCGGREIAGQLGTDIVTKDKVNYFTGFDGELLEDAPAAAPYSKCIVIADWAKGAHNWGAYEDYTPATCEKAATQARKCSVCGSFKHYEVKKVGEPLGHDVKEQEVKATCGEGGYKYKVCMRCNMYLDKDGKNPSEYLWADYKYDLTDPVGNLGDECVFDTWKVIKEATADEDGSKILTCSKCGNELAGSETVIPADTNAKKDEEIKKAEVVIADAAKIAADKSYTADSVKAIEEAKTALNQAIASGTAADVKRATEALQAAVDAAQKKAASKLKASGKTVKASSKKKMTFKKAKAFKVSGAAGKVTFKKTKGNKKVTVSKAGKVTVKKGLKKGKTYKIKVKITDAGSGSVLGATKTVTLKVKVTK